MSRIENYENVRNMIIAFKPELEDVAISEDMHIKNDLGLDSFQALDMVGKLEDRLDIDIPDRRLRELQTIGQILDFLEEAEANE